VEFYIKIQLEILENNVPKTKGGRFSISQNLKGQIVVAYYIENEKEME
jgi:hypothetical protein